MTGITACLSITVDESENSQTMQLFRSLISIDCKDNIKHRIAIAHEAFQVPDKTKTKWTIAYERKIKTVFAWWIQNSKLKEQETCTSKEK